VSERKKKKVGRTPVLGGKGKEFALLVGGERDMSKGCLGRTGAGFDGKKAVLTWGESLSPRRRGLCPGLSWGQCSPRMTVARKKETPELKGKKGSLVTAYSVLRPLKVIRENAAR